MSKGYLYEPYAGSIIKGLTSFMERYGAVQHRQDATDTISEIYFRTPGVPASYRWKIKYNVLLNWGDDRQKK